MSASGSRSTATPGYERIVLTRAIDFYRSEQFLLQDRQLRKLPKPEDANLTFWRAVVLLELRSDWASGGRTWPRGSLLAGDAAAFGAGRDAGWQALFTPTPTASLAGFTATASRLVLNVLDQVASRLEEVRPGATPTAAWSRRAVQAPHPGTLQRAGPARPAAEVRSAGRDACSSATPTS